MRVRWGKQENGCASFPYGKYAYFGKFSSEVLSLTRVRKPTAGEICNCISHQAVLQNKQRSMCFPPPPPFTERHLAVVEECCPTVWFIRYWPCARHNLSYPPTHTANTRTKIRFQCLPDALNLNGYISSASFWVSRLYAGCEHSFNDILQTPTPSKCYTSIHCIRILLKSARPS